VLRGQAVVAADNGKFGSSSGGANRVQLLIAGTQGVDPSCMRRAQGDIMTVAAIRKHTVDDVRVTVHTTVESLQGLQKPRCL
jgi:hypothetical protein